MRPGHGLYAGGPKRTTALVKRELSVVDNLKLRDVLPAALRAPVPC